ncbi:hybrid sensor histidine kinase/response regulator [Cupriavidus necator]|uniref:hybrid sensor histidine kinase/response regulator n=1 Tax=Cupriavidus necator TaxID=106590 RepID=UPI00069132FB|nr:ATP-binding protein [Cupriavidus necator]
MHKKERKGTDRAVKAGVAQASHASGSYIPESPGSIARLGTHFFRLLESLPAGAYTCDEAGLITYFNARATQVWGRSPRLNDPADRYCGSFRLFAADGTPIPHEQCWMALALRNRRSYDGEEIVIERPDGQRLSVLAYANPLTGENGVPMGAVNVLVDVSALKRTHEQLEQVNRANDRYIATLSHELRNPLAPIRSSLETLRRAPIDGAFRAALDIIDRQFGHLARLVDDLLEDARITSGQFELRREPIDLRTAILAGVEISQPLISGAALTLIVELGDEPLPVEGDSTRLAQAVANLLNNSARYTGVGGTVSLTACRRGPNAFIAVHDTGAGIAPDKLTSIFDMFVRGDEASRHATEGLGIGLSLVRTIIELHGGSVTAHSDGIGRGAEFRLRLPLVAHAAATQTAPSAVAQKRVDALTAGRILVVDDNQDAAESARMLLELWGNDVRVALDGASALQIAEAFRPELVLLDIGLPDMEGYDVARALRKQPWGESILLVAVTGWGQGHDRAKSRDAGVDLHLVKPVDFTCLAEELSHRGVSRHLA